MSRRKPTPLFADPVEKHIAGMRTLLGMIQGAAAARDCPSSREAVERFGAGGCPLCGGLAVLHRGEVPS